jgi:hypothetical protein
VEPTAGITTLAYELTIHATIISRFYVS